MANVSITKIKAQLDSGVSREEISKELGLNPREIKALWQHPELKGLKKSKYKVELNFIDDEIVEEAPVVDASQMKFNGFI